MADDDEPFVPFSERPEWTDVKPLAQDDGPAPAVAIAYSEQFSSLMGYFRAVLAANEVSERAFELTEEVIWANVPNYTAWHYRRKLLRALRKDMDEELEFVADVCGSNPKNYQVWYHRQFVAQHYFDAYAEKVAAAVREATRERARMAEASTSSSKSGKSSSKLSAESSKAQSAPTSPRVQRDDDPLLRCLSTELRETELVFDEDAKNFHAWAHRQWVLTGCTSALREHADAVITLANKSNLSNAAKIDAIWSNELKFVGRMLQRDVKNNSVWNQRHFVMLATARLATVADRRAECDFVFSKISLSPNNASPWNYIRGVVWPVDAAARRALDALVGDERDEYLRLIDSINERAELMHGSFPTCFNALALTVDVAEFRLRAAEAAGDKAAVDAQCAIGVAATERLATKVQETHAKYWLYRQTTFQKPR